MYVCVYVCACVLETPRVASYIYLLSGGVEASSDLALPNLV
jgi:hypothetical protein